MAHSPAFNSRIDSSADNDSSTRIPIAARGTPDPQVRACKLLHQRAFVSGELAGRLALFACLLSSAASWTDWSEWSTTCTGHASGACGSGTQMRSRKCPASDPSCNTAEDITVTESRACAPCGAPLGKRAQRQRLLRTVLAEVLCACIPAQESGPTGWPPRSALRRAARAR